MKLDTFTAGLLRLRVNLARPPLSPDVVALLYAEISFVPDSAWPQLVESALERWDAWPRNFPRAVKELWYDWQRDHAATRQHTDCPECGGSGYLWGVRYLDGMVKGRPYVDRATCACSKCDNDAEVGRNFPRGDRAAMRQAGYEIEDEEDKTGLLNYEPDRKTVAAGDQEVPF